MKEKPMTFCFKGSYPLLVAAEKELESLGYKISVSCSTSRKGASAMVKPHLGTNYFTNSDLYSSMLNKFSSLYFGTVSYDSSHNKIFTLPQDWNAGLAYAKEAIESEFWDENKSKQPVFEEGKFYKAYWDWNTKYDLVFKYKNTDDNKAYICTEWYKNITTNMFDYSGGAFVISELKNIQEITAEEADKFVPENSRHKLFPSLYKIGNVIVCLQSTKDEYGVEFLDNICEIISPPDTCPAHCVTTNLPYSKNPDWFNVPKSEIRQATEEEIKRYREKGKTCHITINEKWDVGTYVVVRKPKRGGSGILVEEGVYRINEQTETCVHINGDCLTKQRKESELKWFETYNEAEQFFKTYLQDKMPEFINGTWLYGENYSYKWIFRYKGKKANNTYPSDEFYLITKDNKFQSEGKSTGLYCHFTGYSGPAKATDKQMFDILSVVATHKGLVKGANIVPPNIHEMIGDPKSVVIAENVSDGKYDRAGFWINSGRWNSRLYDEDTKKWAVIASPPKSEPKSTPEPVKIPKFVKILSTERYDWGSSNGNEKAVIGNVYKVYAFTDAKLGIRGLFTGYITFIKPKEGVDYEVVEAETLYQLKFGNLDFAINKASKTATCKHGTITLREIKDLLDYFDKPVSLLGYKMEIKNTGDWFIKFGCCEGTIKEMRAIYKALTT